MQLQVAKIQEDLMKVSDTVGSLVRAQSTGVKIIQWSSQDVPVFPLLAGSVYTDTEEQCTVLDRIPKMCLNLFVMQLESLHALLHGVVEEIHIWEHRPLSFVNEIKVNNQQLLSKKMQFLQYKEVLEVHRS